MIDYEGLNNVDNVIVNKSIDTSIIHGEIDNYSFVNNLDIQFTASKNIDCIDVQIDGCGKSIIWYDDNVIEVQQPKEKCTYIWEVENISAALDIALSNKTPKGYKVLI